MIQIVLASGNPVKIRATQRAFQALYSEEINIIPLSVPSGISDQPMSEEETLKGSSNRVKNAKLKFSNADFWVGIEGGVEERDGEFEAFGWVYIASQQKNSRGKSATFLLPREVGIALRNGEELGPVNDRLYKTKNSKQKGGAIGLLTKNIITREELYFQAVVMALVPHINKDKY